MQLKIKAEKQKKINKYDTSTLESEVEEAN